MDVTGDLIKQIGNVTTPLKLVAFFIVAVLIFGLALLKRKSELNKRVYNLLITIFVIILVLVLAAFFIHPTSPATYTLSVTVTDIAGTPYQTDQAKVTVNNEDAPESNSSASNTWNFLIHADELPKDRRVYISASTNDHVYFANEWDTLDDNPHQTKMLMLGKAAVTSFSINLTDTAISHSLERMTGLTNDPASRANKIVVSYDRSSISPDINGIYSMVPSHPIVAIDGHRFILQDCTVPPPEGNNTRNKDYLTGYARQESIQVATSFLRRNPNVLAQWLKSMQ